MLKNGRSLLTWTLASYFYLKAREIPSPQKCNPIGTPPSSQWERDLPNEPLFYYLKRSRPLLFLEGPYIPSPSRTGTPRWASPYYLERSPVCFVLRRTPHHPHEKLRVSNEPHLYYLERSRAVFPLRAGGRAPSANKCNTIGGPLIKVGLRVSITQMPLRNVALTALKRCAYL